MMFIDRHAFSFNKMCDEYVVCVFNLIFKGCYRETAS